MKIDTDEIREGILLHFAKQHSIHLRNLDVSISDETPEAIIEYQLLGRLIKIEKFESFREVPLNWWEHLKSAINNLFKINQPFKVKYERIRISKDVKVFHICPHLTDDHIRFLDPSYFHDSRNPLNSIRSSSVPNPPDDAGPRVDPPIWLP